MDLAILEWKLVRKRALFASKDNPKGTVRVDTEFNISAMDLVQPFAEKVETTQEKQFGDR